MRILYVLLKKNSNPKQRKMMDIFLVDESKINDYKSAYFLTCSNDGIPNQVLDKINVLKSRYNAVRVIIDEKLRSRVVLAKVIQEHCDLKALLVKVGDSDVSENEIIERVKNNQHIEVNNATTSNTVYIQQLLDPFFDGENEVSPKNVFYMLSSQFYKNSFGYYVKREVSRRLDCDFSDEEQCAIALLKCYEEKGLLLPPSGRGDDIEPVKPTVDKLKNLFNRQTGTREIVFSIAYALEFDVDTVNDFLARHIQTYVLDDRNPIDIIHKYCFTFALGYSKAEELIDKLEEIEYDSKKYYALESILTDKELPMDVRDFFLLNYVKSVSTDDAKIRRIDILSSILTERLSELEELYATLGPNGKPKDDEVELSVVKQMSNGIPKDFKKENLLASSKSVLNKIFNEFQINNQRFTQIRNGIGMRDKPYKNSHGNAQSIDEVPNVRNWIIAINFLIWIQDYMDPDDVNNGLKVFQDNVNNDLLTCGYGPLHNTNAFDCYIMLAICSDDPLGVIDGINEYSYCVDTETNVANSMASLVRRAKRGDAESQFELGLAYEKGEGVKQSSNIALKWIEKAAKQGHPEAKVALNRMKSID